MVKEIHILDFGPIGMYATLRCVFARLENLITKINPNSRGWDGTLNSEYLPADNYWLTKQLFDKNGISREKKGHFSLKK